jgi:heme oxygenase
MIQEELRKQTTAAHQQLEKLVISRLKTIRSNEDYANLLKIFYAYFNRLEEAIRPYISAEVLPDYADRRHAVSLADDVICLGAAPTELPEVTVPSIDNTVKALGALYVMEGSVMGGSIIIQMLARHGVTEGVSFFGGYGSETGAKWASFASVLDRYIHKDSGQEAIETANQTFSNFANVFLQSCNSPV